MEPSNEIDFNSPFEQARRRVEQETGATVHEIEMPDGFQDSGRLHPLTNEILLIRTPGSEPDLVTLQHEGEHAQFAKKKYPLLMAYRNSIAELKNKHGSTGFNKPELPTDERYHLYRRYLDSAEFQIMLLGRWAKEWPQYSQPDMYFGAEHIKDADFRKFWLEVSGYKEFMNNLRTNNDGTLERAETTISNLTAEINTWKHIDEAFAQLGSLAMEDEQGNKLDSRVIAVDMEYPKETRQIFTALRTKYSELRSLGLSPGVAHKALNQVIEDVPADTDEAVEVIKKFKQSESI